MCNLSIFTHTISDTRSHQVQVDFPLGFFQDGFCESKTIKQIPYHLRSLFTHFLVLTSARLGSRFCAEKFSFHFIFSLRAQICHKIHYHVPPIIHNSLLRRRQKRLKSPPSDEWCRPTSQAQAPGLGRKFMNVLQISHVDGWAEAYDLLICLLKRRRREVRSGVNEKNCRHEEGSELRFLLRLHIKVKIINSRRSPSRVWSLNSRAAFDGSSSRVYIKRKAFFFCFCDVATVERFSHQKTEKKWIRRTHESTVCVSLHQRLARRPKLDEANKKIAQNAGLHNLKLSKYRAPDLLCVRFFNPEARLAERFFFCFFLSKCDEPRGVEGWRTRN